MGLLFGSWQQTDTHWLPLTTTVAVLVSVVPLPLSVPAAAPPLFSVTPNHGSGPIMNAALAGIATIVAVVPAPTVAVCVVFVDAVPPLIVTEHQLKKFMTVRVSPPPPLDPLLDPLLELAAPSAEASGIVGDELLLHATAPATVSAAMLAIPTQSIRCAVLM